MAESLKFALRVQGDSMVNPAGPRSYPNGCVIIVDPARKPKPGERAVARLDDGSSEVTFGQLERQGGRLYLRKLNPRYAVAHLLKEDQIIGAVVQTQISEDE